MDIIQPEIIPENQRIRLLRNGDKKSVYKPVGTLATELKRKPQTLREWAKLLLIHSPDFYQHFKPRTAYNPYVQEWLARINSYDITEPSSAPRPQIVEDYIQLNAPIFTFQNYLQELNNEYQTEVTIDNAIVIKVA
jgi:hypothetical protein